MAANVSSHCYMDDYDTDHNLPLSQYGSSTGNDREPLVMDGRRKVKPNILRRAMHNRARRRMNRPSEDAVTDTDETNEVPSVKHTKNITEEGKEMPNEVMSMLKDIQNRLTKMELDNATTATKLNGIEGDIKKLNSNSIGKENLVDALRELSDNIKGDLNKQGAKIKQNEEQLVFLTEGLNATNQDLRKVKKDKEAWEEDILKHKVKSEQDKATVTRKMNEIEEALKKLKVPTETKAPSTDRGIKNIILEGLNEKHGEDVYCTVIHAIKELGINIFDNDINLAYRLGTHKGEQSWPRPIRVEFVSTHVKEVIWESRRLFENSASHYNVRISRDEKKEVRMARAILRKAANRARNQGKTVYQHQDHILIDGQKFENAATLEGKIPTKRIGVQTPEMPPPKTNQSRKLPAERITKKGLAFFTKDSKRSCFYPVTVTYEGVEYKTPEHNYRCIKALTSKLMDLYHKIKDADTPKEAKILGANIPYNPIWEGIKPDVMYKIQLLKHEQHPELGEELCQIEGVFMEASLDRYWGTGVTILNESLDTGKFGGRNELGRSLNRVKDTLLSRRSVQMMDQSTLVDGQSAPHSEQSAESKVRSAPLALTTTSNACKETTVKGRSEAQTSKKDPVHSPEIEVLETDIQEPVERPKQPWEPNIVIKEGTIVV